MGTRDAAVVAPCRLIVFQSWRTLYRRISHDIGLAAFLDLQAP